MKTFRFLFAACMLISLTLLGCGPGEGTGGRTGDYDRHNHLDGEKDTTDSRNN